LQDQHGTASGVKKMILVSYLTTQAASLTVKILLLPKMELTSTHMSRMWRASCPSICSRFRMSHRFLLLGIDQPAREANDLPCFEIKGSKTRFSSDLRAIAAFQNMVNCSNWLISLQIIKNSDGQNFKLA
jgi:hypothetical protein